MPAAGDLRTDDIAAPAAASPNIEALLARLDALEGEVARLRAPASSPSPAEVEEPVDRRPDRRDFLRIASVAATGAAAAAILRPTAAAAADNEAVFLGTGNNPHNVESTMTAITHSGAGGLEIAAFRGLGPANSNGVWGTSLGNLGAGVFGTSDYGYGVFGAVSVGYDLYAGGNGRQGSRSHLTSGTPVSGAYAAGDVFRNGSDTSAELFVCVLPGTGSAAQFRKLAGPSTAGALHVITPFRAYDSRPTVLTAGSSRIVQIANGSQVPTGARAVFATLTITNTTGSGGWIATTAGDVPSTTASSINWFAAGQTLATTVLTALDGSGRIKMFNNSSANTDFIVDVTGYFV